ncbi:anthranilate phosphoribosyltransferase [Streptomyces luteolifulvus]|jgi:anthranilate phosphoribosyltransferase|uniref:Anthranilate phosphoribosyltransferase n=1 Tax=Streptomyces luteolifulvus TaxID=2615112 RepID=A0A6H9UN67_9ACTN|nr:anthranilate phosphoribosyltransferase [Streptomyces luteolifulvus]KAB1139089.1 anthranilate phosphoribosyltransferase [Streptomyces luteolifulvus]
MGTFKEFLAKTADGHPLTRQEAADAFTIMTTGEATPSQIGAFLMALRVRGETVDEITGAATSLRSRMRTVKAPIGAVDIVGTGGDASGSYNISTCAGLIVAGVGVPVAKHGNRALSSRSGATDVLSALGVRTELSPAEVEHCISAAGIGFMHAPNHHPALKHVAPTRVELATRTVFNILGPLLNPAGVRHHLVGVYSRHWVEPLAQVLGELGSTHALVVHGSDGLDEVTTTGPTYVAELADGVVKTFEITPDDVGIRTARPEELRGGTPAHNAESLKAVLDRAQGPYRDIAVLNAAAALLAASHVTDFRQAAVLAAESIDSGRAGECLSALIEASNANVTGDAS